MAKPKLPRVPKGVKHMAYRPAGGWERGTLPKMFARSMGAAAIFGIIAQFLGLGIPLLLPLWFRLGDWVAYHVAGALSACGLFVFGVIGVVVFFGVAMALGAGYIVFPVALGSVIGGYVTDLAVRNKTRSLLWVSLLGFVSGLVGYGVCLGLRAIILGSVDSSYSVRVFETPLVARWMAEPLLLGRGRAPTGPENSIYSQIMFYLLLLLDVLLVHGTAILTPYGEIGKRPFCDRCNEWYTQWTKRDTKLEVLPGLLHAVETGTTAAIADIPPVEGLPKATITLERCPSCQDSKNQLTVTVQWREEPSGPPRTKQWLRVMIPAALGQRLAAATAADEGGVS